MKSSKQEIEDKTKESLRLAGRMANVAGIICGQSINNGCVPSCNVMEVSSLVEQLSKEVSAYNEHILKMMDEK